MHYLITSSNYDDFMSMKNHLEPVSDVDNISEICGNQVHPWHAWLTHKVANIVIAELIFVFLLLALTFSVSAFFDWSMLMSVAFFTIATFFSVWVSGLIGWHTIHLYSICQSMTEQEQHPLALLVESSDRNTKVNKIVAQFDSSRQQEIDE